MRPLAQLVRSRHAHKPADMDLWGAPAWVVPFQRRLASLEPAPRHRRVEQANVHALFKCKQDFCAVVCGGHKVVQRCRKRINQLGCVKQIGANWARVSIINSSAHAVSDDRGDGAKQATNKG